MDPIQKEYDHFLAVCETLNISRAAEGLGIQQGGLSKSLKRLEESLGEKLVVRKGRGLVLTEFGRLLQKEVLGLKKFWEQGFLREQESLEQVRGTISIGAHSAIALNYCSEFVPKLNEEFPELRLELSLNPSSFVTRAVIEYELDFGFVANPAAYPDLVIKKLRSEFIGLYCTEDIDRAKKVIYYNPEMHGVAKILTKYSQYKHIEIRDYEVLASISLHSKGLFFLPSSIGERLKKLRLLKKVSANINLCLIYRIDRPKTSAFVNTLEVIKSFY